jgi:putative transposase
MTMLAGCRRKPGMIVSDNGTEFTANARLAWPQGNQIVWHSLRQESRCRTASVRASTGACATSFSMRACSLTLTTRDQGLDHARSRIANWIDDYKQRRPHSALGYLTPTVYAANLSATCDRPRNPDQLRRSPVAPPASHGVKTAEAPIAAG